MTSRRTIRYAATAALSLGLFVAGSAQDSDLDARFIATLEELARMYDEKKDPESVHLFAECAIGFGSAADAMKELKKKWENEVYYGRSRGGKVLQETAAIEKKLGEFAKHYRGVVETMLKKGKGISPEDRATLQEAVVRYEIARGANEYVQATQRINELRLSMKLRAILWDFEASKRYVLAAWYMGESGDYTPEQKSDESSINYSPAVEIGKKANRCPRSDLELRNLVDDLRSLCIVRDDLLNPDARRIGLGRWEGGKKIPTMIVYRIPRTLYRPDIATPSRRARETVAEDRDLWADVEESIKVDNRRVIYSHYPYHEEGSAPYAFGDGRQTEFGWTDPEVAETKNHGLAIMIRWFTKATPTDVTVDFRKHKGLPVGHRVYLNGDRRVDLGETATLLILPDKPLDKGTAYAVSIRCKIEGAPFEKSWTFTTRRK